MIVFLKNNQILTEIDIPNKHLFLGECFGVALISSINKNVTFMILVEDDESWFESKGEASSYWLPELHEQIGRALLYLDVNARPWKYGWRFND